MKNKIFMKGNWENLIIKTFSCEPKLMENYLPKDVVLDLYNEKALFSMVAFTFSNVSFFGVKIPFHQRFGEINFRVYVKSKNTGKKGVVFLKEYAPKPIMAFIANYIYNEPFLYKIIKQKLKTTTNKTDITYSFKSNNKRIKINAIINTLHKKTTSSDLQKFIVDRYIAFVKGKKTLEYKITHKPWKIINAIKIKVPKEVLNLLPKPFKNSKEISTYVVDGSEIEVEKGILI